MKTKYEETKSLLGIVRKLQRETENQKINETLNIINNNLIVEQGLTDVGADAYRKINVPDDIEDTIEKDEESKEDKKQAYRVSGGIIVLHGKDKSDLEMTTDEKQAFQDTKDEFITEVSDLVEFNQLNVYPNNVEWSGKIIDMDVEFFYSIGENNGVYINGTMNKVDENYMELLNKLQTYYDKFKSKWAKILTNRKTTRPVK